MSRGMGTGKTGVGGTGTGEMGAGGTGVAPRVLPAAGGRWHSRRGEGAARLPAALAAVESALEGCRGVLAFATFDGGTEEKTQAVHRAILPPNGAALSRGVSLRDVDFVAEHDGKPHVFVHPCD